MKPKAIACGCLLLLLAGGCGSDDSAAPSGAVVVETEPDPDVYLRELTACVRETGIDVEVRDDDTIFLVESESFPRDRQFEILETCRAEMVERGLALPPGVYSEPAVREGYARFLEIAECLDTLGYSSPPAPSLDAILENPDLLPDPYEEVFRALGPDGAESVLNECAE